MSDAAAAWHTDPTGRHQLRYWDGARWTEHVSDGGVTSVDPLPGDGGPTATTAASANAAAVDVELKVGLTKRKRLRVDDAGVTWDGTHVPFDSITAFTYHAAGLAGGNTQFGLELWAGKKRTSVSFVGGEEQRAVYRAAADVLFERLGRPTLEAALATVDAGGVAELAGWSFDRSGAHQGKASMPWSAPYRLVPSTTSSLPCTYVFADVDGKERRIGLTNSDSAHSCLMPIMFDVCSRSYG